jgi:dipeptidyl aminopeptidase/acylaminoacyl peptidase
MGRSDTIMAFRRTRTVFVFVFVTFAMLNQAKAVERHPLSVSDVLGLRVPTDPQISSDGRRIVFSVEEAALPENKNHRFLYLLDVQRSDRPQLLMTDDSVADVRWQKGDDAITFLSSRGGSAQIWRLHIGTEMPEQLTHHPTGILEYAWSADGSRIAFVTRAQPEQQGDMTAGGVVFDDAVFGYWDLINNSWAFRAPQLWEYETTSKEATKLWEQTERPLDDISWAGALSWSPDNSRIAFVYTASSSSYGPIWASRIAVIEADSAKIQILNSWNASSDMPKWSSDGKRIAFRSTHQSDEARSGIFHSGLDEVSAVLRETTELVRPEERVLQHWWLPNAEHLIERSNYERDGLYRTDSSTHRLIPIARTSDHMHNCTVDAPKRVAACVRENSTISPELAVVDLGSGMVRTVTQLNPEYRNFLLGDVVSLKWHNSSIPDGQGYLVMPVGYVRGRRYPFLVVTYNFNGGFVWQAQWIPNYPVQVFAARGYATLLVNPPAYSPGYRGYERGKADEARVLDWMGGGVKESLENAVRTVEQMGIADPERLGIMGLSGGADVTDLMVTQTDLFKAGSSADGSSFYGPVGYVLGGISVQRHVREMGVESPYANGGSLSLAAMTPSLSAFQARTPLLMEYRARNAVGLELYTALKGQGKPVELVFYPYDGHVLTTPIAREASMTRNLEWFDFWLNGHEDLAPSKSDQYTRWEKLCDMQVANNPDRPSFCVPTTRH